MTRKSPRLRRLIVDAIITDNGRVVNVDRRLTTRFLQTIPMHCQFLSTQGLKFALASRPPHSSLLLWNNIKDRSKQILPIHAKQMRLARRQSTEKPVTSRRPVHEPCSDMIRQIVIGTRSVFPCLR